MDEERVRTILTRCGAFPKSGHYVLGSGQHSDSYVDTDGTFACPRFVSDFCYEIGRRLFCREPSVPVEAIAGPAVRGGILAQEIATQHTVITGDNVYAVFANETSGDGKAEFAFSPTYRNVMKGKRVLVVNDVSATGASLRQMAALVRASGGIVTHTAALVNRGGVTAQDAGVEELITLLTLETESWPAEECPLCRREVPVNIVFGHGREFLLARRNASRA